MTINTAFDIHDQVYYLEDNEIKSGFVHNINISVFPTTTRVIYYLRNSGKMKETPLPEERLFPTKAQLRQSL